MLLEVKIKKVLDVKIMLQDANALFHNLKAMVHDIRNFQSNVPRHQVIMNLVSFSQHLKSFSFKN